jgi:hypothetical protein
LTGSFNNMGVPGAIVLIWWSQHMETSGFCWSPVNPYYARFCYFPGSTILKDALDQSPTFFLYGQEMTC